MANLGQLGIRRVLRGHTDNTLRTFFETYCRRFCHWTRDDSTFGQFIASQDLGSLIFGMKAIPLLSSHGWPIRIGVFESMKGGFVKLLISLKSWDAFLGCSLSQPECKFLRKQRSKQLLL